MKTSNKKESYVTMMKCFSIFALLLILLLGCTKSPTIVPRGDTVGTFGVIAIYGKDPTKFQTYVKSNVPLDNLTCIASNGIAFDMSQKLLSSYVVESSVPIAAQEKVEGEDKLQAPESVKMVITNHLVSFQVEQSNVNSSIPEALNLTHGLTGVCSTERLNTLKSLFEMLKSYKGDHEQETKLLSNFLNTTSDYKLYQDLAGMYFVWVRSAAYISGDYSSGKVTPKDVTAAINIPINEFGNDVIGSVCQILDPLLKNGSIIKNLMINLVRNNGNNLANGLFDSSLPQ